MKTHGKSTSSPWWRPWNLLLMRECDRAVRGLSRMIVLSFQSQNFEMLLRHIFSVGATHSTLTHSFTSTHTTHIVARRHVLDVWSRPHTRTSLVTESWPSEKNTIARGHAADRSVDDESGSKSAPARPIVREWSAAILLVGWITSTHTVVPSRFSSSIAPVVKLKNCARCCWITGILYSSSAYSSAC